MLQLLLWSYFSSNVLNVELTVCELDAAGQYAHKSPVSVSSR